MTEADFDNWLRRYGEAWETRDVEKLLPLFTEDALYYETPFDAAVQGHDALREYWSVLPAAQDQIYFHYRVVVVLPDNQAIANWWASFIRLPSQARVKIDGVLICEFEQDNRCRIFREWWHRQEIEGA